ncbi:MAG: SDR family NAD(P)-dependent oxidoreductase [Roseateles sp.]|uniref:SDR family NAD(P)-dependent oxidoreductase n=1 Tax=Roseateles sp. TaxID=1971397 RepID=UPI0040363DAB
MQQCRASRQRASAARVRCGRAGGRPCQQHRWAQRWREPAGPAAPVRRRGLEGQGSSAALEYAEHGVRVNCIGPGYVATPRMMQMDPQALEGLAAAHPLGRLAKTEEVAELAAFLLSERAAFCTGAFYPMDGGYTAQ